MRLKRGRGPRLADERERRHWDRLGADAVACGAARGVGSAEEGGRTILQLVPRERLGLMNLAESTNDHA